MSRRLLVLVCMLAGCKARGEPVVARLEHTTAQVERMPRAGAAWQPAKVGDTFILGSGVRTGSASHAKLRVGRSGKLDVIENSVVYFSRTPAQKRDDLRIETGAAELETGDDPVSIGEAVLDPSTRARIEASPSGTKLVVTVGRAVLEDGELVAGGEALLDRTGKRTDKPHTKDAGIAAPTSGGAAISVRDKPIKVEDASGSRELPIGDHEIAAEATLAVPEGGTIEIVRGGARAITVGASTLRIGNGNLLVQMISGALTLHGEGAPATATVPGGKVTAQIGGDVALVVDGKDAAIDAQRGETIVSSAKGDKQLAAGQSALLHRNGELAIAPPAPDRTVVTIAAGESPTLHDTKAPTPVRVTFEQACPKTGVVELAKDRAFKKLIGRSGGAGSASILVPAGSFNYRVRCPGARGASGTIRIAKDSGRNPLPAAAARTTVDMDGREYTVLYQNVLPELTLAWRNASRAKSYSFVIKPSRGSEKRIVNSSPSLKLMSGELREGSYKVWVEPAGGTRSEEARVVIEFDNAAQSASIDRIETTAGKIRIKGTVIEGSTVTAAGAAVDLDRQRRFSTEVAPGEREDGVGVRIAHPRAGIHYYVMRTGPT